MHKNIRSKKYRDAARGTPCIKCGRQDDTVIFAHYQGFRSHAYGKGTGIKPHDPVGADLCRQCHESMDQYDMLTKNYGDTDTRFDAKVGHSEEFQHWVIMTMIRRYRQGVIKL